jgi:hypothetical protein
MDDIAELFAHISAATARWLRLLAELDERGGWNDGYKSLADWLSWRCGISPTTARDHVRVARALTRRPLVAAAFERGELSYSKVRALTRLDESFTEELMLNYAQHSSASQIETIVRGCRRCVAVEQGAERQFAEREFSWHYDADGAVVFNGRLPAEMGAVVIRAIEAARDELGPPPREIADGLSWDLAELTTSASARRADAFVAVAKTALTEKASSADVYQVVVHVDAHALDASAETPGRCTLEDGEPLPVELARKLSCDASIVRVVENDGKTISLGRKTRTIPPALRRALRIRDKTCRFPGCTRRHHLDGHHIKHWADGGATDLENLLHLCGFHHDLIHTGRYRIVGEDGDFKFVRANGEQIPQAPRLPRGDCTRVAAGNTAHGIAPSALSLSPRDPNPRARLDWATNNLIDMRTDTAAGSDP